LEKYISSQLDLREGISVSVASFSIADVDIAVNA
jgi:hypothetical protein